jgi:Poly(ADP-ribose) polymerase catalytic domain
MTAIKNTHSNQHHFTVNVKGIFEIEKPSEKLSYLPFEKKLHNKFLLWAGVRANSVLATMRDGLLVPGQESSVGLMFGRGIYLTDCFSKAANQSCSQSLELENQGHFGVVFLMEAALGDMH